MNIFNYIYICVCVCVCVFSGLYGSPLHGIYTYTYYFFRILILFLKGRFI